MHGKDFMHANEPFIRAMISAAWASLILAGCMETGWAVGLKYSAGFSRLIPSVATIALMAGSFYFLSQSLKDLPLGTAYAVWTGIGALGTVMVGMAVFGESRDIARVMCLFLIVGGILGLKLVTLE
jgi:quaternary ammonium compound-resistance protein SugE